MLFQRVEAASAEAEEEHEASGYWGDICWIDAAVDESALEDEQDYGGAGVAGDQQLRLPWLERQQHDARYDLEPLESLPEEEAEAEETQQTTPLEGLLLGDAFWAFMSFALGIAVVQLLVRAFCNRGQAAAAAAAEAADAAAAAVAAADGDAGGGAGAGGGDPGGDGPG